MGLLKKRLGKKAVILDYLLWIIFSLVVLGIAVWIISYFGKGGFSWFDDIKSALMGGR